MDAVPGEGGENVAQLLEVVTGPAPQHGELDAHWAMTGQVPTRFVGAIGHTLRLALRVVFWLEIPRVTGKSRLWRH